MVGNFSRFKLLQFRRGIQPHRRSAALCVARTGFRIGCPHWRNGGASIRDTAFITIRSSTFRVVYGALEHLPILYIKICGYVKYSNALVSVLPLREPQNSSTECPEILCGATE
jgi:hypothetical protein